MADGALIPLAISLASRESAQNTKTKIMEISVEVAFEILFISQCSIDI